MAANSPPIASLLRHFHAHKPARIWSLIVTLYGDTIVPRGGSLWIGSLIEIMELFRIDAGHVRTAISRLSSDGWLTRVKRGRASYYRLSKRGEGAFLEATRRIYFGDAHAFDGHLRIALIGSNGDASVLRRALSEADYAPLSPNGFVGLDDLPAGLSRQRGLFVIRTEGDAEARALAAAAWKLDAVAEAYRAFTARHAALDASSQGPVAGADALVARTLLIHAFRRIVLRDPGLPAALLPPDWPGCAARELAGRIYRRLVAPSEAWLDAHATNENGPLPPPGGDFADRFRML
jgi:phenylacetic acid degradation operon negative regulatory protein